MSGDTLNPSGAVETISDVQSGENVVVGIPAFNEEIGIGSVVLASKNYSDDVIVVDDGSTDRTAEVARKGGAEVIELDENRGKGRAIRTLLNEVRAREFDALVLLDGDGQHLPAEIPDVVSPVLSGDCDIVIGSRYLDSGSTDTPLYRRFGQRTLDFLTTGSARRRVSDSQSGFRALSPSAVENLVIRTDGMGVESEMISDATDKGLDIEEVPIDVRYEDVQGQTYNPLRHGLLVAAFVTQLIRDRHPLLFFGVPGILILAIGGFLGLQSVFLYQSTGLFYQWRVVTSSVLTVIGVIALFCGLILSQIANMINDNQ